MSNLGGKNVSEDTDKDLSVDSVVAGTNIDNIDSTDPRNPIINAATQAGGQVDSVVSGTNCSVDATDPVNPIVNADTQNNAKVTTKGDLEGFSTVAARIPVGTNGQVLTADSAEALGLKWANVAGGYTDPLTTKGDLVAFNTATDRLAVGTNDQVLTADSTAAEGVAWKTPSGGGGAEACRITRLSSQSMDTSETIQFTAESYDDNSFADLGTNNDRLTVPTGVTRVNVSIFAEGTGQTSGGQQQLVISQYNSSGGFLTVVCGNDYRLGDASLRMSTSAIGVTVADGDFFQAEMSGADAAWTLTKAFFAIQDVSP